jgi:hypothetical protein
MRKRKTTAKKSVRSTANRTKRRIRTRRSKHARGGSSAKIHQGVGLGAGSQSSNPTLTEAAVKIGAVLGKADRTAHQLAAAGSREIAAVSKLLKSQKSRLKRAGKRLGRSFS